MTTLPKHSPDYGLAARELFERLLRSGTDTLWPTGHQLLCRVLSARDRLLGYPEPPIADSPLDAMEQAFVAAAIDAYFPPGGAIPISGAEAGLLEYCDAYLKRSVGGTRVLIHLLMLFLEMSPLAFGPRRARFSELEPADRVRFLEGALNSRIYFRRLSVTSLRTLMTMGYIACPAVSDHMGVVADTNPFGLSDSQEAS